MSPSSNLVSSGGLQRAGPIGHPVAPVPDPEPGNLPQARLAEVGRLAAQGTAWVLRRSNLVPYLLAMAARRIYGRADWDDQLLAPPPAAPNSWPPPGGGAGTVVNLAAYRQHSRTACVSRSARNAARPSRSWPGRRTD